MGSVNEKEVEMEITQINEDSNGQSARGVVIGGRNRELEVIIEEKDEEIEELKDKLWWYMELFNNKVDY